MPTGGLRQFPEQLAAQALQEDPDLVAVSSLSGSHGTLVPELMRLLAEGAVEPWWAGT